GVPPEKIGELLPRFSGAFKIADGNSPMNPQQTQLVKQRLSMMGYAGGPQEVAPQVQPPRKAWERTLSDNAPQAAPQTVSPQPAPQRAAQPDATPSQRISQGFADAGIPASGIPNGN